MLRPFRVIQIASVCALIGLAASPRPVSAAAPVTLQSYAVGSLPGQLSIDQGAASYSIPIGVPPGVAGVEPELAFSYNSRGANGPLGIGWSLSGQSAITRCPMTRAQDDRRRPLRYDPLDRLCLDGQRLVLVEGEYGQDGAEYRTEIDGGSRIRSYGVSGAGPQWFKVETKAGQTIEYGNTEDARVVTAGDVAVVADTAIVWAMNSLTDAVGNRIDYEYHNAPETGEHYLSRIRYADNLVEFLYEDREDRRSHYYRGHRSAQLKRLYNVVSLHAGVEVSRYHLEYEYSELGQESRLVSIAQSDAEGNQLPPTRFGWSEETPAFGPLTRWNYDATNVNQYLLHWGQGANSDFIDINSDGLPDRVNHYNYQTQQYGLWVALNNGAGFDTLERWAYDPGNNSQYSLTWSANGNEYAKFIDIDGDGLLDRAHHRSYRTAEDGLWVAYNDGKGFGELVRLPYNTAHPAQFLPSWDSNLRSDFVDINGDGIPDRVNRMFHPTAALTAQSQWGIWVALGDGGSYADLHKWSYDTTNAAQYNVTWVAGGSTHSGFLDINADGLPDRVDHLDYATGTYGLWVSLNTGNDFAAKTRWAYNATHNNQYIIDWASGVESAFLDINGDGLPDKVNRYNYQTQEHGIWVALNDGHGLGELTRWAYDPGKIEQNYLTWRGSGNEYAKFIDMNGDGLPDRVIHYNYREGMSGLWVAMNRGDHFDPLVRWDYQATNDSQYIPSWGNGSYADFVDMNGDGLPDRVNHYNYQTQQSGLWVALNKANRSVLSSVSDGLGTTLGIDYGLLTDPLLHEAAQDVEEPLVAVKAAMQVVSATHSDTGAGQKTVSYRYGGALMDRSGRGFLGFAWDEATDVRTGVTTRTEYRQDHPYTGMPRLVETWVGDSESTLSEITTEYQSVEQTYTETRPDETTRDYQTWFPYAEFKTEKSFELNGGLVSVVTTQQSGYDNHGNVGTVEVKTTALFETFTKTTVNDYDNNIGPNTWQLGRLKNSKVTHTHPTGVQIVRESSFTYYEDTGLLKTETVEPNKPQFEKTTTYTYDSFGNKQSATVTAIDGGTRTTTTQYDALGRFPEFVTNALGHTETHVYDPALGKLRSLTGPNGLTTTWDYDTWGRKTAEHRADGTSTVITREWVTEGDEHAPALAVYKVSEQGPVILATDGSVASAASPPVTQYYDRLGRVIRKLTTGFDGRKVYQDTEFDAQGREYRSSLPYYAGDTAFWAVNHYDAIGRVYKKTMHTGKEVITTEIEFNGLHTTEINSLGQRKTTTKNALGKVAEVVEEEGGRVTYYYDAIGNLRFTHQHGDAGQRVVTEIQYDDIGANKTVMEDPDMGRWEYAHNAFGELISQTDAKGQVVTMHYDKLGRMWRREEPEGVTEWRYDTAPHGVGKLDSVAQYDTQHRSLYRQRATYDALGRQSAALTEVDGHFLNTTTDYDTFGRVWFTRGPDGFQVFNRYNENGYLLAKQSPLGDVADYDVQHLSGLKTAVVESAGDAVAKAQYLAERAAFLEAKAEEYEGLLSVDWSDAIRVADAPVNEGLPTRLYSYMTGAQLPAAGRYDLYASTANASSTNGVENYFIRVNASDTAFSVTYYPRDMQVCVKYCIDYQAGWLFSAVTQGWINQVLANGTYIRLSTQYAQVTDIDADGTPDLLRYDEIPRTLANLGTGILVTAPFRLANAELTDGTGYRLYTRDTAQTGSRFYLEDVANGRYFSVWTDDPYWYWDSLTEAEWLDVASELQTDNDRLFLGDFNGDGTTDAIRVPAGGENAANSLTDELRAELLALAEDTRAASRALQAETDTALDVADQLLTVASHLDDLIRQADYWLASSQADDLDAMDGSDGFMTWWRATARDAAGRLSGQRAGNGLVTINDYDPATGHLNVIQTGFAYGTPLRRLAYEYDSLDNVIDRYDHSAGVREHFQYDRLNRLTESQFRDDGSISGSPYLNDVTYRYDALGNITLKTDVSDREYGYREGPMDGGPHAVNRVQRRDSLYADPIVYDANGSMLRDGLRDITWSSYNKPTFIQKGDNVVSFAYGSDRARYRRTSHVGMEQTVTYYLGGQYERVEKPNGDIEHKYYIQTEDGLAAVHTRYESTTVEGYTVPGSNETQYMHRDALGSVDLVTDARGEVVTSLGYTAFGARRAANGHAFSGNPLLLPLRRGYTGHEHLDEVGLIHMNGRVYDPGIGRFLSADPHVQAPYNSQSYNRYSYALNNPLKYTDPSGYFFKSLFKAVGKFLKKYGRMILAVAAAAFVGYAVLAYFAGPACFASFGAMVQAAGVGGAMAAGAASGFVGGLISTGSLKAGIRGAAFGALSGAAGFGVGSLGLEGIASDVVHGLAQGLVSEVTGGDFKSGFLGAALGHFAGAKARMLFPGTSTGAVVGRTLVAAVAGGTSASMGGGKFANGAVSAAFVHLFNNETQSIKHMLTGKNAASPIVKGYSVEQVERQQMDVLCVTQSSCTDVTTTISGRLTEGQVNAINGIRSLPPFASELEMRARSEVKPRQLRWAVSEQAHFSGVA